MKKLVTVFIFCFAFTLSYAQQNVISSGNNSESVSGKVTYSVGLIHYKEATGIGGSSSVGSQIPFEVLQVLGTDDNELVSISIYPNPTSNIINIKLLSLDLLKYQLIDLSGRNITSGNISNLQTQVKLQYLESSIYILNILKNNKILKSYKISKK